MLVKITEVQLPRTAAERFSEAGYFFECMRHTAGNLREFPVHLDAFLASVASLGLALNKQFSDHPQFQDWFSHKQAEMSQDPDLRMLNKLCADVMRLEPVGLVVQAGPSVPEEGVQIDGEHGGYVELGADAEGNVTAPYRVNEDTPVVNSKPVVCWRLGDENGPDVVVTCGQGLLKIKAVLEEWYHSLPKPSDREQATATEAGGD